MKHKILKYYFCLLVFTISSCTDFIAEKDLQPEWEVIESNRIVLHYRSPGFSNEASPTIDEAYFILHNQELYYRAVCDSINRDYSDRVLIYLFNSDEADERTGTASGGHSIPKLNAFYFSFFHHPREYTDKYGVEKPFLGAHELVHVITHQTLGYPGTRLMSEGYANWLDGSYARYDIPDIIISYRNNNPEKIMNPDELLNDTDRDESVYYPNAGLFTGFLVNTYGIENINRLFNCGRGDLISDFENICYDSWVDMTEKYSAYIEDL